MLSIGANSFTDSGLSSDFSSALESILSVLEKILLRGKSRAFKIRIFDREIDLIINISIELKVVNLYYIR